MKHSKTMGLVTAALLAANSVSAVAATSPVRPGMVSLPSTLGASGSTIRAGKRVSGGQSSLLGAPLFLLFLGAVAVTIGTIIIVNHNNSSPG